MVKNNKNDNNNIGISRDPVLTVFRFGVAPSGDAGRVRVGAHGERRLDAEGGGDRQHWIHHMEQRTHQQDLA